ncbi:flagellar glycosyl transferase, FgtA domain protein [Pseudomonas aeruginosa]|nr:flagellar glycosyl transferase, FgtA domain protein [Pseudomonas aeruginosa]
MPGDIRQILGRALGLADRFVVSTEPLAEAFRRMHGDIRVVPNRLPLPWCATFPVGAGTQSGHGSDGPAGSAMAAISR